MQALDRKLLRDFRRLWAQALAIALVLACGVAILLTTFGMYGALEETQHAYYERNRFADVFAEASRVPRSLMSDIQALDGVRAAEARIAHYAVLDIPGNPETVTGRILSLPETGEVRLNVPVLREGRLPYPGATDEVAVNMPFAEANGLRPGDPISANLNGQKRELTVTGTLLSPEYIYTLGPGALMPDNETFGILWMPENTVAAAFDMEGAFNSVSLKLGPAAVEADILDALDDLMEPYGGYGAYGRDRQLSHSFVDSEMQGLRSTAMILPPIFFGITAFLVGMVLSRIIMLERSEIGLLKAIGYSDAEICIHYLMLAGLIALGGTLIGWSVGTWAARALARLYATFFDFPYLIYDLSLQTYAVSAILAILSTTLGAIRSALSAARMAPAVAMAPPAPPRFKRTFIDRILAAAKLSQPTMMILRSLIRWPVRSALTTLGLSLAVSVLVASGFFPGAMDEMIDTTFYKANRQDAVLLFDPDVPETALAEVRRLPGVLLAEGQQSHAATLRHGHLSKDVGIEARRPGIDLARILDDSGAVVDAPGNGILLSERLAGQLGVGPGDLIEVEFRTQTNEIHAVRVAGTVTQYIGIGAYMDLDAISRLLRQSPRISAANLLVDDDALPDLHELLKNTPNLTGLVMLTKMHRSFEDTIRQNITTMTSIYVIVAILVTVGVAYNGARIQLSERARELASLRILGYTRGEVSYVLMGETMVLALLAQPLGWLLGIAIVSAMIKGFDSDLYTMPMVLTASGFARASLVVLAASLVSSLIVRRRLDRLDLVQVMKTRE